MNIKRVIICMFLIFILYLLRQWLNKSITENLKGYHKKYHKKHHRKDNSDQHNITVHSSNIANHAKKRNELRPNSVFGLGQLGESNMIQNGYYIDKGPSGGYYYGGGQPANVKYIYSTMRNYYPYWYKYLSFT